jgi:hypothetical protein
MTRVSFTIAVTFLCSNGSGRTAASVAAYALVLRFLQLLPDLVLFVPNVV